MNHLSTTPPDADTTRRLLSAPWVAMDTEFDGPAVLPRPQHKEGSGNRPMPCQHRARLVGYSLWAPGCPWDEGVYFDLGPNYAGAPDYGPDPKLRVWLWNFLKAYDGQVWFHNALADLTVLTNSYNGFPYPKNPCDSMVLAWCLGKRDPRRSKKGQLTLDTLATNVLGVEGGKGGGFGEVFGGRSAGEVEPEEMAPYAARDAWYTGRLVETWLPALDALPRLRKHVLEVEMPLLRVVAEMRAQGVAIDTEAMQSGIKQLNTQTQEAANEFYKLTQTWVELPVKVKRETGEFYKNGKPKIKTVEELQTQFVGASVASGDQVARWLVDELEWWPRDDMPTTATGRSSIDSYTVGRMMALPDTLASRAATLRLRHSKTSKLAGTYLKPFPLYAGQSHDGRIHCDFHQTGTETGRFSSSNPNMQNLPRSQEEYLGLKLPNIRAGVVAPPGRVLVGADYAQLELRIVAHLADDPVLVPAFQAGADPHQGTIDKVKEMFGIDIERSTAKITNFSTIYRIGAPSLSTKLGGADVELCRNLIKGFYEAYPGLRGYHRRAIAFARKHGYTEALGGFRMRLGYPEGKCETPRKQFCKCNWCRASYPVDSQAVNYPVQGSAGVIIKRAMVELERRWRERDRWVLLQVHDELLCEVAEGDEVEAAAELSEVMESVMKLRVPLKAEAKWGKSWACLK